MLPGNAPYVTPTQLTQYIAAATLNLATLSQQTQHCLDATELADSYLRGRFGNGTGQPFIVAAVGNDVVRMTAAVAIYNLMDGPIGWAAQAGSDRNIRAAFARAVGGPDPDNPAFIHEGWFVGVQKQKIHPDITPLVAIGSNQLADVPQVFSNVRRGWTSRNGRSVGTI